MARITADRLESITDTDYANIFAITLKLDHLWCDCLYPISRPLDTFRALTPSLIRSES